MDPLSSLITFPSNLKTFHWVSPFKSYTATQSPSLRTKILTHGPLGTLRIQTATHPFMVTIWHCVVKRVFFLYFPTFITYACIILVYTGSKIVPATVISHTFGFLCWCDRDQKCPCGMTAHMAGKFILVLRGRTLQNNEISSHNGLRGPQRHSRGKGRSVNTFLTKSWKPPQLPPCLVLVTQS